MHRSRLFVLLVAVVSCALLLLALHDHLSHSTSVLDARHSAEPVSDTFAASSVRAFAKTFIPMTATQILYRPTRHRFVPLAAKIVPDWRETLYFNEVSVPDVFMNWDNEKEVFCDRHMIGFNHEFAYFSGMTVNRDHCKCSRKGGEFVDNVINQDEQAEYYKFEMGCFELNCKDRPAYYFTGNNHLSEWFYSVSMRSKSSRPVDVIDEFTIAVTRYEYANLYHTMTDWYNAFLVMQFFNQTAHTTNILIIDAHPYGALDHVWTQLFNSTTRLSALPRRTQFKQLVWGIIGYNSLMTTYLSTNPPLYEEFRSHFLSSFRIDESRQLNCKKPSILFIWRHDYIAHPRNPSGTVSRKISNEEQLVSYVQRNNKGASVRGFQFDQFNMTQQLQFIVKADVLVGMHGAGMSHVLFLPKWAAVIELIPSYWSASSEHFQAIAAWRNLVYERWMNNDPHAEIPNQSTNVPPHIINTLIRNSLRQLCGSL